MSAFGNFYRRILALFTDRPSRFSWVDEWVAASGRPMTFDQLKWIQREGIDVILSLTEEPLPQEWIRELGFEYHHVPIEDHSAPSPEVLKEAVNSILSAISRRRKVLVHCAAGLGRTGTVLAAYMIAQHKLTPEEAIKKVRELRPGSIELQQEYSVYQFYEKYFG